MSIVDTVVDHVREHQRGMVTDLLFAIVWVTVATVISNLLGAPTWARYLLMASGVVAYFLFFWSLAAAKQQQR